MTMVGELYDLDDMPPMGVTPKFMHALAVRQDRFGEPQSAWRREGCCARRLHIGC